MNMRIIFVAVLVILFMDTKSSYAMYTGNDDDSLDGSSVPFSRLQFILDNLNEFDVPILYNNLKMLEADDRTVALGVIKQNATLYQALKAFRTKRRVMRRPASAAPVRPQSSRPTVQTEVCSDLEDVLTPLNLNERSHRLPIVTNLFLDDDECQFGNVQFFLERITSTSIPELIVMLEALPSEDREIIWNALPHDKKHEICSYNSVTHPVNEFLNSIPFKTAELLCEKLETFYNTDRDIFRQIVERLPLCQIDSAKKNVIDSYLYAKSTFLE